MSGMEWEQPPLTMDPSVSVDPDYMSWIMATLAVAFAAFCVWLTVRIVNRRERWAKWTLTALFGVPVLYVLSFGPVCWMIGHTLHSDCLFYTTPPRIASVVYRPLIRVVYECPEGTQRVLAWYFSLGMPAGSKVEFANSDKSFGAMCMGKTFGYSVAWIDKQ